MNKQRTEPIKAITLWQPWATLIALGAKQFETRSWAITYRGPLVIHASKRLTVEETRYCRMEPFRSILAAGGYYYPTQLPTGKALCVVDVVGCLTSVEAFLIISDQERAFGNYQPDRFAWKLASVRRFAKPVPIQGMQGLWTWPSNIPLPEADLG